MKKDQSLKLFESATKVIPGGVNSPVRACKSVGTDPIFIERANGCMIVDADGNEYIDYIGSWGPMILGHRHPDVVNAIKTVLEKGTSFGAPTELEIELARIMVDAVPSMDMVRMVNSGTEATMSAIRLARGFTGRDCIVKFDGCYHGHADSLLVEAGSGVATLNIPGSPGVPKSFTEHTLSLPYNDMDGFKALMDQRGDEIACVIIEPVAGNMGLVTPDEGFLETLRTETEKHGALLIFDEVMTGFRVAYGSAQTLFDITPDISCFGKIIGGGLPVGAYGGKAEIMNRIAPVGDVYQAGTLSGNPLAMAAGIATLKALGEKDFYQKLDEKASYLLNGFKSAAAKAGIPVSAKRVGSMMGLYFTDIPVRNFTDAKTSDLERFKAYYKKMLEKGVYLAPSQFEALFVSIAHDEKALDHTIEAAGTVFETLKG